jgi:hypothetical protein
VERVKALVLALVLSASIAAGCGGSEGASPPATSTEAQPTAPAADRPLAPPLAGETLDGEVVSLEDLRGTPVFVNVWSSW